MGKKNERMENPKLKLQRLEADYKNQESELVRMEKMSESVESDIVQVKKKIDIHKKLKDLMLKEDNLEMMDPKFKFETTSEYLVLKKQIEELNMQGKILQLENSIGAKEAMIVERDRLRKTVPELKKEIASLRGGKDE